MSKTIAIAITLGVVGVIGIAIWKYGSGSKRHSFALPGWDDLSLRDAPPKDIEWTCHRKHPADPDECEGQRDTAIGKVFVLRRPDLGVIAITSYDLDASTVELLRKQWGAPTKERKVLDGIERVWCSRDHKDSATLQTSSSGGASVMIETLIGKACEQAPSPEREPVSVTTTNTAACRVVDQVNSTRKCSFSSEKGAEFQIDEDGLATRTFNGKRETFRLPLQKSQGLQRVWFAEYEDDTIVIFQAGNYDAVGSGVMRIGGATVKPTWSVDLGGFNVGEGIVLKNRLYISAIKLVACLDLNNGRFIWRHEDVGFDAFGRPELDGDDIVFPESDGRRSVRVRRADGVLSK